MRGNRPKSAPSVEAPLGGPVGDAASEAFNLYYDPMVLRAVRRGEKVLGQKTVDTYSLGSTLSVGMMRNRLL